MAPLRGFTLSSTFATAAGSSGPSGSADRVPHTSFAVSPNTRSDTGVPSATTSSNTVFSTSRAMAIRLLPSSRCSMLPDASSTIAIAPAAGGCAVVADTTGAAATASAPGGMVPGGTISAVSV